MTEKKGVATVLEFGEHDNGRLISGRVGDVLSVRLGENASTGYRWSLDKLSPSRLELIEGAADYPKEQIGSGGEAIFRFRVIGPGASTLSLKYCRAWEGDRPALRRFVLKVAAGR